MIEHIIRLGKAMDDKYWPLLISLKEEDKKIRYIPEFEQNERIRSFIQQNKHST